MEVRRALLERIVGPERDDPVVWSRGGSELLVHGRGTAMRATAGFLVTSFQIETAETGPTAAQVVLFLGARGEGDGLAAAASQDASTPSIVVDAWGDALRTAVWESVLDILEGAAIVASRSAGVPLRVLGFTGGEDQLVLSVGA